MPEWPWSSSPRSPDTRTARPRRRHEAESDRSKPEAGASTAARLGYAYEQGASTAARLGYASLSAAVEAAAMIAADGGTAGPDLRLAHLDDWLAVVDKPAGLVVHPAPGHHAPTLVDLLGDLVAGGESTRPGIVHRLDRDTSGLMLVARGEEAHRRLAAMVKAREVERIYVALVEGRLRSREGTIDAPLGRDHRAPERRAVGGRGAREARTHFRVLETLRSDTLVEVRLETGRTHQIRAHFAAIGHPVAGDPRYGHGGRHGLRRQFLHSARLGLVHPFTGTRLGFASELPDDLAEGLRRLESVI